MFSLAEGRGENIDACRLVELDLTINEITKHFLHLCLLRVLKYSLLPQGLIAERV